MTAIADCEELILDIALTQFPRQPFVAFVAFCSVLKLLKQSLNRRSEGNEGNTSDRLLRHVELLLNTDLRTVLTSEEPIDGHCGL